MERIKTNIVKLSELSAKPCNEWLRRFNKNGEIDAHKAFEKYGEQYWFLYQNSNYDLIGWQIENNCFDWEKYSWVVAEFCPQSFDKNLFNWEADSDFVALFCPEYFDKTLYNWKEHSWAVAKHSPQNFDKDLFNWEKYSHYVTQYSPQFLHLKPNLKP